MTIFNDFARIVLGHRAEDGIRGIKSELNRYAMHIEPADFAKKDLEETAAVDIRDWLRGMSQKNAADTRGERRLSTDTIKRSFALVSSIFTAACERDLIKVSPTHGVRVKRRADERATKDKWAWLTLDEQKAIAACEEIPATTRLTIRFAIATGLRQGEQFSLRLTDLHTGVENPHVLVRYGSKNLPPKSGKVRRVPLFGDGLVAARRWLYELPSFAPDNPFTLVFPSPRGTFRGVGKPLGRGNAFREEIARAGVTRHIRWHDLRHTFCSNLVSGVLGKTWPLVSVKEMAGHSSVTITERYAHVGQRDLVNLGEASSFAHGPMPIADTAPDTERDVAASFDEAFEEEAVAS